MGKGNDGAWGFVLLLAFGMVSVSCNDGLLLPYSPL
jgi:hypothetical protein